MGRGHNAVTRIGWQPLLGLGFGVYNSSANHGFGPFHEYASKVVGNGWAWLAMGFLAAWTGHTRRDATRRAVALLLPAVLGYYVSDAISGTYTNAVEVPRKLGFDVPGLLVDFLFYSLLAGATAIGLGVLVTVVRRGGITGLLAALAVPAYIARTAWDLHQNASHDPRLQQVSGYVAATALGAMLLILLARARPLLSRSRRGEDTDRSL